MINRREWMRASIVAGGAASLSTGGLAEETNEAGWRTFEITTVIEVLKPDGVTRIWTPAPLLEREPYQRTLAHTVRCDGGRVRAFRKDRDSAGIVAAEIPVGVKPAVTIISRVATRNFATDLRARPRAPKPNAAVAGNYLISTKYIPTDGIVKETAAKITKSAATDLDKARAIYEWVVENTYRNPETRGCGLGNIRFMLESGDLGGKCADLNALYVGLARAAGLPARDVYGIRTAPSALGYKSLGTSSEVITKAQHCRAEVYLRGYGWAPVDPADVRKVMLEEPPGNRPPEDEMVKRARTRLFGSWEMNWMAYNFANDVELPGASGPALPFFMYPQAETAAGRVDSLDADSFRYEIRAKEI